MSRVLCVWFPRWPIQRLQAARPELSRSELVLFVGQGQRLVDVVVEHLTTPVIEVEASVRHVALYQRDDRGAAGLRGGQRDRQCYRHQRHGHQHRGAEHQAADQALGGGDDRGCQSRTSERDSGRDQRCSGWLNAQRPHGKPPNGSRSRSASSVTQAAAVQRGAQRSRPSTVRAAPRAVMNAASANGNSSHTSPTYTPLHDSSGPKNAHPHR